MKTRESILITREVARDIINNSDTKFFGVYFIGKDGKVHVINGHNKVSRYLKGGKSTTEGRSDLLTTYSIKDRAYRNINLDRVFKIVTAGKNYLF